MPAGILDEQIDSTLIATMDSFGKSRGEAAHKGGITHEIDPKTEAETVANIIGGLREIDEKLSPLWNTHLQLAQATIS